MEISMLKRISFGCDGHVFLQMDSKEDHEVKGSGEDNAYWATTVHHKRYKIFMMYKSLIGELVQDGWKKIMINNYVRPGARFILWMAVNGKLPTNDRLAHFGIISEKNYCFCDKEESMDHLFIIAK